QTASKIKGLGTAGASGLLSLLYPTHYGTVDQFVVKALRRVQGLAEASLLERMNAEDLSVSDGVLLTDILRRRAQQNNQLFASQAWTQRKIEMVLWTYGRPSDP